MKRSRVVGLALMGAAPFALTACDDPKTEAVTYSSVESCIQDGVMTPEVCRQEYQAAQQRHQQVAPHYGSAGSCEAQYGANNCVYVQQPGIGSYFVPAMAGFMIARALDSRDDRYYGGGYYGGGYYGGSRQYRSEPLYKTREDRSTWRTASNAPVGTGEGRHTVSSKAITGSRGGFGSRASARGGWGS